MIKILDFWAEWCGPCRMMKPHMAALGKEMEGQVEIEMIDTEAKENQALVKQYGVSGLPCFIFLKDGQEVFRHIGAVPKEKLKGFVEQYL